MESQVTECFINGFQETSLKELFTTGREFPKNGIRNKFTLIYFAL